MKTILECALSLPPAASFPRGLIVNDTKPVKFLQGYVNVSWWTFPDLSITEWILYGILGFIIYCVVVISIWNLYLEFFDHRTSYERWQDRADDDADQIETIRQWHERKNKKKNAK